MPLPGGGSSYRVSAAQTARRITWPQAFGRRFTIFVDTEEEFDWSAPFDRAARAVTAAAAIPDAARRFADLGASLTYLVDHPIATDPAAIAPIARVLEDGVSAVGTQLHPWVNPPFDEVVSPANSFAGNLPRALEAAKLAALTDAITAAFGTRPRIYRAGRYGLGPDTLGLLAQAGYRIDTSMRARYDYSAYGGPNYAAVGSHGFVATTPAGDIAELPLTTVYTGALRAWGASLAPAARALPYASGALSRAGLLSRVALTPEDMPLDAAMEAVRVVAGEGLPLLNLSFHSPSLVPGHTPYVRDAADLAEFWRWWDRILGLIDRRGLRAASADQLLAALPCATPAAPVSTAGAGGL